MQLMIKIKKALKSLRNPLFRRALRFGVSPSHEHRDMLASLGEIKTVIDVGANVGQFALIARNVFPGAEIHSFEPLSQARLVYEKVMAGQSRVTLYPFALGIDQKETGIYVSARSDSSSLLAPAMQAEVFPGTHGVRTELVKVTSLDKVLARSQIIHPAILKIDVQGYEMQVLSGCKSLLDAFDYVFVELSFLELYAGQSLAPEVISWLSSENFDICGVHVSPFSHKNGVTVQCDFLFRRGLIF